MIKLYRVFFKGEDHYFSNRADAFAFGNSHGLKGYYIEQAPFSQELPR